MAPNGRNRPRLSITLSAGRPASYVRRGRRYMRSSSGWVWALIVFAVLGMIINVIGWLLP